MHLLLPCVSILLLVLRAGAKTLTVARPPSVPPPRRPQRPYPLQYGYCVYNTETGAEVSETLPDTCYEVRTYCDQPGKRRRLRPEQEAIWCAPRLAPSRALRSWTTDHDARLDLQEAPVCRPQEARLIESERPTDFFSYPFPQSRRVPFRLSSVSGAIAGKGGFHSVQGRRPQQDGAREGKWGVHRL